MFASVALLFGNRWDAMPTAARIATLALPALVAAIAGWWIGRRDEPALRRLGSVLWLLAVAGLAGLAAEIWVDAIHEGDPPEHNAALFIGAVALAGAAPAWWMRRRELQQLAFLAAATATSLGVVDAVAGSRDREMAPLAAGLTLLGLGAVWLVGGVTRRLPPAMLANICGSAPILIGAQVVHDDGDQVGLWLGLVASVGLMVVGVARSELEVLVLGTIGLFQWTPQIALFYLEDALGAEVTLFLIGTLLIAVAGGLTRMYPWLRSRGSELR